MMARLLLLLMLSMPGWCVAAIDAYPFTDPVLEVRYDNLIAELRCPQCLNTNLAGSDAMIAQDLRREVHKFLLEGKSDQEILDFMYERYGDFILYEPRVSMGTMALWFGPLAFLALAGLIWFRLTRRELKNVALSDEDRQRVDAILAESDQT